MTALRPVAPLHAAILAAIHRSAFPPGQVWGADAIALQLGLPGVFGLLDDVGGFVLARVAADEAELLTVAVASEVRRRGIGRRLVEAAIAETGRRDCTAVFLEVSVDNRAARSLYASCGFAEVGRRPRYYPGGVDAAVLRAVIPCGSTIG